MQPPRPRPGSVLAFMCVAGLQRRKTNKLSSKNRISGSKRELSEQWPRRGGGGQRLPATDERGEGPQSYQRSRKQEITDQTPPSPQFWLRQSHSFSASAGIVQLSQEANQPKYFLWPLLECNVIFLLPSLGGKNKQSVL